jgi:hypothetical protein
MKDLNPDDKVIILNTTISLLEQQILILQLKNSRLFAENKEIRKKIIDLEMESIETLIMKHGLDI